MWAQCLLLTIFVASSVGHSPTPFRLGFHHVTKLYSNEIWSQSLVSSPSKTISEEPWSILFKNRPSIINTYRLIHAKKPKISAKLKIHYLLNQRFKTIETKVASCDVWSQVAMWECKPIFVETCNVCACSVFRCAKCDCNFIRFFITKDTNPIGFLKYPLKLKKKIS